MRAPVEELLQSGEFGWIGLHFGAEEESMVTGDLHASDVTINAVQSRTHVNLGK